MRQKEISFEESLNDNWDKDSGLLEVPLANRTFLVLGLIILLVGILVVSRLVFLSSRFEIYAEQAFINLTKSRELAAPRGLIYDRHGKILAENQPSFLVFLNTKEFLNNPVLEEPTLQAINDIIGIGPDEFWKLIREAALDQRGGRILLAGDLDQSKVIPLKSLNLKTLSLEDGFRRVYYEGPIFASVLGYTGLVNAEDLKANPFLSLQAVVGRTGLEAFYDGKLRGQPGKVTQLRDALGEILSDPEVEEPIVGQSLQLTIDAELQSYFFNRLQDNLESLGRSIGVGLAMNPKNGEILALFNIPSFDNNLFSASGRNEEKIELLNSPLKPLFNRSISGLYNPGSTIKPLVALAALKEGVITPEKEIFSPGYLDIPNPYNPDQPTRFLDWRYQGFVNLAAAIAQSSNVYFYTVGGGFGDIKGLGINRLHEWWQRFQLGKLTGIDLPAEAEGLLPSIKFKKKQTGQPWRLGDTFNVSIGQGDLLLNPLQILNYLSTIANGGKLYRPFINADLVKPKISKNLSYLLPEIREVQQGLLDAVRSNLGTAHSLNSLPFSVGAKTGSAEVNNKTQENAFFVGYAPADDPEVAILVLIENSKEGSLNTLPVAKDVLNWYYENRIKPKI